jgi:tRNA(Ile2) C34 agmatinyltransferase TiaS
MKKLEFDQKIFDRVCNSTYRMGYAHTDIIKRYLELAQEPPKPVIEGWVNVCQEFGGSHVDRVDREDAMIYGYNSPGTTFISTHHLRYNHETGKIEDITEGEDDK